MDRSDGDRPVLAPGGLDAAAEPGLPPAPPGVPPRHELRTRLHEADAAPGTRGAGLATRPVDRAGGLPGPDDPAAVWGRDRKSTRLNSSHVAISYAVFCLKKKTKKYNTVLFQYKKLLLLLYHYILIIS